MKRALLILFLLIMLFGFLFYSEGYEKPLAREMFFSMDTVMSLSAEGKNKEDAVKSCREEILRLDGKLSRTDEASLVYKINEGGSGPFKIDDELFHIFDMSLRYNEITGGCFDITTAPISDLWGFTKDSFNVPDSEETDEILRYIGNDKFSIHDNILEKEKEVKFDLGGAAKGYALDSLLKIYNSFGIKNGLINMGGDILAAGKEKGLFPWNIYIQDPLASSDEEISLGIIKADNSFVITSGNYQRYFEEGGKEYQHIIDPHTGRPSENELCSVTVIAPAGEDAGIICDMLATAIMVMGREKAVSFQKTSDFSFDMILVTKNKEVLFTEGLKHKFTPTKKDKYTYSLIK